MTAEGEHLGGSVSRSFLERSAIEGESPVGENTPTPLEVCPKYRGERKPCGKQAGLPAKAKYSRATDSEPVP